MAKTHIAMGVSAGLAIADIFLNSANFYFLVMVFFGSVFPDIDERGSYISNRMKFVSMLLSNIFEHRGVTHTLVIVLLYGIVIMNTFYYFDLYNEGLMIASGFMIGNIAHIIADMATPSGVSIFYPLSDKRMHLLPKGLRVKTFSKKERYIILPLFSALMVFLLYKYSVDMGILAQSF